MPGAALYWEFNRRAWSLADTKVGQRPQESSEVARGMALPEDPEYGLDLGRPRVYGCVWEAGGASISDDIPPEGEASE